METSFHKVSIQFPPNFHPLENSALLFASELIDASSVIEAYANNRFTFGVTVKGIKTIEK